MLAGIIEDATRSLFTMHRRSLRDMLQGLLSVSDQQLRPLIVELLKTVTESLNEDSQAEHEEETEDEKG